jgi:hypothetical protein
MEETELLNHIHSDAKMGQESTESLMNAMKDKDNKIKDVVEDIIKSYEDFVKKSEKILSIYDEKGKNPNLITNFSADMGIKFKMLEDNSDAAISDMLIRGLTMGEIEMTKKIENFAPDTNPDVVALAKEFKNFQSNAIVKLKKFL